jgi:ubiquinone/menaquinone biosynthesis C-methylase UbiE
MVNDVEQYTMGYGPAATALMASRTAQAHAAFLRPHLKPGMKVLDCGCGPGSITLGLAEIVAPGQAVGTDIEAAQLEVGRAAAKQRGLNNVSFERADAYALPFADDSFDAIFISAMLGNLREPLRGVQEARRVLKPGGVLAVKEFDHGGDLLYPVSPDLLAGIDLYNRLRRHNGHDPDGGRKLLGLLQQAGLRDVTVTATYDTVADPAVLPQVGGVLAALVSEAFAEPLQRLGWATPEVIERITQAWREFPTQPGAFYAMAWCEALAWK